MSKTALATQISPSLKRELDETCEYRGLTISRLVEDALREKLDDLKEEEVLLAMAMERLAEVGECSHAEFKRALGRTR